MSIVKGFVEVTRVLERLHGAGLSHRALRPTAIVMNQRHASLRDFGLATVPPRRGENAGLPGAGTGARFRHPPRPRHRRVPVGRAVAARPHRPPACRRAAALPPSGSVPDSLAQAVSGALRQDPAARPDVGTFRLRLRAATRDLLTVPPQR
ncbi:hypothetical protein NKH77_45835 [Streptomyces sp. M19]